MRELLNTGVNIGLDYNAEYDALIGQIKGYSVAVKENLSTGSYGCLFWIKKGDYTAITTAEEYLAEQQKRSPELVKKFMVNDTGAAVALNRTTDDFANVNNLKRFIYDFASNLTLNYYKNCCCECGSTESLSIYDAEGTIAQACSSCGAKYVFIRTCAGAPAPVAPPEVQTETAPAPEAKAEENPFAELQYKPEEKTEQPPAPTIPENDTEEFSLKEFEYNPDEAAEEAPAEPVPAAADAVDVSELMYTEADKPEEAPIYNNSIPERTEEPAESFGALLYEENKPEPEKPRSKLFEEAEREFAAEKEKRAAEEAKLEDAVDNLLITEGEIVLKEIVPESDDGTHDVTEVHDDSNDGEDFDIEEIESTVEMPTVTTGHPQLEAEETPLEEDGSVPLINPNSHREERHVSPVDGPDAVQPLEFGQANVTYEKLSEETAPRYSAGGEINRGYGNAASSSYNHDANYSSYTHTAAFRKKSRAFTGIIGALVLGLLGLAAWLLLANMIDVISVWGSLVVIFAVYGGYKLGGKVLDKKGIVISFILTLVAVFAGAVGICVFDTMETLKTESDIGVTFLSALERTLSLLETNSLRKTLLVDMFISMGAALIGDIIAAVIFWKKAE